MPAVRAAGSQAEGKDAPRPFGRDWPAGTCVYSLDAVLANYDLVFDPKIAFWNMVDASTDVAGSDKARVPRCLPVGATVP